MLQAATEGNKEVKHKEVSSPAHNKKYRCMHQALHREGKTNAKKQLLQEKMHGQAPWRPAKALV